MAILEWPISREIVARAPRSIRFRAPFRLRIGGPPAAGGFQPVIAS